MVNSLGMTHGVLLVSDASKTRTFGVIYVSRCLRSKTPSFDTVRVMDTFPSAPATFLHESSQGTRWRPITVEYKSFSGSFAAKFNSKFPTSVLYRKS